MAYGNTESISALRRQAWQSDLYVDAMDKVSLYKSGLMGKGDNVIVEVKDQLAKEQGEKITYGLAAKLSGNGVTGDNELEGKEEKQLSYSDSISIDQIRNGEKLKGRVDEQKACYNMRMTAKSSLSVWLKELYERQIFLKAGGVRNIILKDTNSVIYSANALWSNSPTLFAGTSTGSGARYICANSSGVASLSSSDKITPALISRMRAKAELASPTIQPLTIEGEDWYVLYVHPWQANDLKANATFAQARREALERSKSNPTWTGALFAYDGVMIRQHKYVPYMNTADVGTGYQSFAGSGGTDFSDNITVARALLFGKQAVAFAHCDKNYDQGWVEKSFDYGNVQGYSIGFLGGIQVITFNSLQYGVIALDTFCTPQ